MSIHRVLRLCICLCLLAVGLKALAQGEDVKKLKTPSGGARTSGAVASTKAEGGFAIGAPAAVTVKSGDSVPLSVEVVSTDADAAQIVVNAKTSGAGLKGARAKYRKWIQNLPRNQAKTFTFTFKAREKGSYTVTFFIDRVAVGGEKQSRVVSTIVTVK